MAYTMRHAKSGSSGDNELNKRVFLAKQITTKSRVLLSGQKTYSVIILLELDSRPKTKVQERIRCVKVKPGTWITYTCEDVVNPTLALIY